MRLTRRWQRHLLGGLTLLCAILMAACSTSSTVTETQTQTPTPGQAGTPVTGASHNIKSIDMNTATAGWATTTNHLLHTNNGGQSWGDITPAAIVNPDYQQPIGAFLSENEAWITPNTGAQSQSNSTLYHTTNGGQNWQNATVATTNIIQITFVDAQHGWLLSEPQGGAAGSFPVEVWRTTDGGTTWTKASASGSGGGLPAGGNKNGLAFKDANTGWAGGGQPTNNYFWFFVTHDGGTTWQQVTLSAPSGIADFMAQVSPPVFSSATDGALSTNLIHSDSTADLYTYFTHDGGTTWSAGAHVKVAATAGSAVVDYSLAGPAFLASQTLVKPSVVAPADNGPAYQLFILSADLSQWTTVALDSASAPLFTGITQLDVVSATTGWAVSGNGPLHTTNGGVTWSLLAG